MTKELHQRSDELYGILSWLHQGGRIMGNSHRSRTDEIDAQIVEAQQAILSKMEEVDLEARYVTTEKIRYVSYESLAAMRWALDDNLDELDKERDAGYHTQLRGTDTDD